MVDPHVIEHFPGPEGPPYQRLVNRILGGRFVYTDASTITLAVVGLDQWMYLSVSDGQDLTQIVRMFSDLICDLSVSGAGGLHNDYAEAIDTPYVIYAAWDPSTVPDEDHASHPADLVLFAVPSGTVVDAALVAALTGGGAYSWWSEPIGLMVNDGAGDVYPFIQLTTRWFRFNDPGFVNLLAAGTANILTVIDCSAAIPYLLGIELQIGTYAHNAAAVQTRCSMSEFDGVAHHLFGGSTYNVQSGPGGLTANGYKQSRAFLRGDPSTAFSYQWIPAVPTYGLQLQLYGVKLY